MMNLDTFDPQALIDRQLGLQLIPRVVNHRADDVFIVSRTLHAFTWHRDRFAQHARHLQQIGDLWARRDPARILALGDWYADPDCWPIIDYVRQRGWPLEFAVAHDTTTTGENSNASPLNISHTASGSDRIAIAVGGTFLDPTAHNITGVTYAGTSMNNIYDQLNGFVRATMWQLVAPSTGAQTVAITIDNPGAGTSNMGIISSYTGVDQTTPVGTAATATGNTTTSTVNVSSATDELVVDGSVATESDHTVGAGQTERASPVHANGNFGIAQSDEAGAATVTMSWTLGATTTWATGGVGMKPAAGGTPVSSPITSNYEALAGETVAPIGNYESLARVAPTLVGNHEALSSSALSRVINHEALARANVAKQTNYESLTRVAPSLSANFESLAGIPQSVTINWEAKGQATIATSVVLNYEALLTTSAGVARNYEALGRAFLAPGVDYESLISIAQSAGLDLEALFSLAAEIVPNYETSKGLKLGTIIRYEALLYPLAAVILNIVERDVLFGLNHERSDVGFGKNRGSDLRFGKDRDRDIFF